MPLKSTAISPSLPSSVYQLKVSISDARLPIWRRVLVPAHCTLYDLHRVIQVLMGWEEEHLHVFHVPRGEIKRGRLTRQHRIDSDVYKLKGNPWEEVLQDPAILEKLKEIPADEPPESAALREFFLGLATTGLRPYEDYEEEDKDEVEAYLDEVAPAVKRIFFYTYDMGDSWEHQILVEKILPADPDTAYPVCIAGNGTAS